METRLQLLVLPWFAVALGLVCVLAEPAAPTYAADLAMFTGGSVGLFGVWLGLAAFAWRARDRTFDHLAGPLRIKVVRETLRSLAMGAPLAAVAGAAAGLLIRR